MMKKFNRWFNSKYAWFFTNGRKAQYNGTLNEIDAVSIALANAYQMSLEVEVVTWALKYMKENPNLTIDEAITMGYYEWVK
jgi:hypothetical protein